eukprot:1514519-Lingulodinium_polyedra.AAC.1
MDAILGAHAELDKGGQNRAHDDGRGRSGAGRPTSADVTAALKDDENRSDDVPSRHGPRTDSS